MYYTSITRGICPQDGLDTAFAITSKTCSGTISTLLPVLKTMNN